MEDLGFDGYEVFRRGHNFTIEETKSIMQIFGQFHALSIAYKDQRPSEFEDIAGNLEVFIIISYFTLFFIMTSRFLTPVKYK